MLKVYTSHYSFRGQDRLDITVKTGDKTFAPTWDMVIGIKQGNITEEEYTKQYIALMTKSYNQNREKWLQLLQKEQIVLVCFCGKDKFCHRHILAKMLVKLGAEYKGEI